MGFLTRREVFLCCTFLALFLVASNVTNVWGPIPDLLLRSSVCSGDGLEVDFPIANTSHTSLPENWTSTARRCLPATHHDSVIFFDFMPPVDELFCNFERQPDPTRQEIGSFNGSKITISTCIPAMVNDMEQLLAQVLRSTRNQSTPSEEIIMAISNVGVEKDGEQLCIDFYENTVTKIFGNHTDAAPRVRVLCVGERLTAGRARNLAASFATSDYLAYIDSDDVQSPYRNEFIRHLLNCYQRPQRPKIVIHSFVDSSKLEKLQQRHQDYWTCERIAERGWNGEKIYDLLGTTHKRLWISQWFHHGHVVVQRDAFKHVRYSSLHQGQDSLFIRDLVYMYGRKSDVAIGLEQVTLTGYYPRESFKDLT